MRPPLTKATKSFWESYYVKRRKYPFWVITPANNPRPEIVQPPHVYTAHARYGQFVHLFVPTSVEVVWGFATSAGRDEFIKTYEAQPWP